MYNNLSRANIWNEQVWQGIDKDVLATVGEIRVAQKVFHTEQLTNVAAVPADVFNFEHMSISEGQTKPYIEIAVEFPLTYGQVNQDASGRTGATLSKLAAVSLAVAEDMVLLQGHEAGLPPKARIESGRESAGRGILGLVKEDRVIRLDPPDSSVPTNSGAGILAAVTTGIGLLYKASQAPPFAMILDTNAYAATWGGMINGAPAYTTLNPLLPGGIYFTGAMPANTGLLIALGGDPTTIYWSDDPKTEHTQRDREGHYSFRVFERVQIVARDHRAFVRLDFPDQASSAQKKAKSV